MKIENKPGHERYRYEHLLVFHAPFRYLGTELLIEAQARHGLERWLDSFENMAVAAPVIPDREASAMREISWVPLGDIESRVQLFPLPWAYRPDHFIRKLPSTIKVLDFLVNKSRYLQFAIGGVWGDWAAVAAELAIRQNRAFSVHTDRVEHEFLIRVSHDCGLRRRWKAKLDASLIKIWHKRIISHCNLGLFHGMDTFNAFKSWMEDAGRGFAVHNIHDIHDENLSEPKQSNDGLTQASGVSENRVLKILYAGRMAAEKAPGDWLKTITRLRDRGVPTEAVWAGDGPWRDQFAATIRQDALQKVVETPGFIPDRSRVGMLYRSADVFMFTHVTPESPRCLLEALRFGVPIIGYESAFASDLIAGHGGGVLVPCGNWEALSEIVTELAADSARLDELKRRASFDGERFSSRTVFAERSKLIRKFLP
jgi:glycosyltransferase involved in cell wall biosynthesis